MSSGVINDLIPTAVAAHSRAIDFAGSQTILVAEAAELIIEAADDGLFTVTVPFGAAGSKDIQWVAEELRNKGYTVTFSTTNFVVTW